jgi:hypothetical protein
MSVLSYKSRTIIQIQRTVKVLNLMDCNKWIIETTVVFCYRNNGKMTRKLVMCHLWEKCKVHIKNNFYQREWLGRLQANSLHNLLGSWVAIYKKMRRLKLLKIFITIYQLDIRIIQGSMTVIYKAVFLVKATDVTYN